jgi:serine/threonine protein kinase
VIAQSDLKILQNLDELTVSATALSTTCKSDKAARQPVRDGLTVCVLSDELLKSETATIGTDTPSKPTSSSPSASRKPGSLTDSGSSSNDASSSSGSRMSNKSMILIGGGCFAMGLIVAAYVFLVRRDRRVIRGKSSGLPTFAPDASDASSRAFGRYFRETGDYTNASWVVGSPVKDQRRQQNGVAILEDDSSRRGRGRSKVDDLLVYEIPLDEIQIKEVLAHKPRNDEALHMAEYQGFQVVMHTLLDGRNKLQRGRRRVERDFVEQVRLASMLEHVCIVQFIGITLGSQRQSMHQKQKWKMGAVFEYMHCGSLASIFHEERMRREGRQFNGSSASRTTSIKSESGFSWYPSLQASIVETSSLSPTAQRSKLALALDVAMALSYLHAMGYAHGDLRAEKVLVNEQGEAKLSGMDISLAVNVPELTPTRGDVRASAVKARLKVKSMFQSSISHSPALGNSLLNSGAAVNGGIAPVAMSSMTTSAVLISANSRAWRRGMQGDIYAFGLLLWELDTMMCVDAMKRLTAAATEIGEEHQLLRFSPECPVEIQNLARRCWHPELKSRPTALDLQEEIVRLLEGRLTSLSDRSRGTHRWSRRTNSRNGGSWSFASSHSSLSRSDYRSSSLVISETEV